MPGLDVENYWFRRHEAVYRALAPACTGQVVVDAGVGEGYGAALLASWARRVVALELDPAVAAHVAARYPQVPTVRADLQAFPVADGSLDAVVTLQVIEHLGISPASSPSARASCARAVGCTAPRRTG